MLKSKELRAKAWESLRGKYWMAFLVAIVLGALGAVGGGMITCSQDILDIVNVVDLSAVDHTVLLGAAVLTVAALLITVIGLLLSIFIGGAAKVGLCNYFIKNTDSRPSFKDAFSGFKVKYSRNIGTLLLVAIKVFLWTLLLVIPGIIKTYEYAIIPYILADEPAISSGDAFRKARELMKGNKWRLFKLEFSFIGWFALSFFTLGIGAFFLLPYVEAAKAEFYVELKNKQA